MYHRVHIPVHLEALQLGQAKSQTPMIEQISKIHKCYSYERKSWHIVSLHVTSHYRPKLLWQFKESARSKGLRKDLIKHNTEDQEHCLQEE